MIEIPIPLRCIALVCRAALKVSHAVRTSRCFGSVAIGLFNTEVDAVALRSRHRTALRIVAVSPKA